MLQLEFPNESHKEAYDDLIKEWGDFESIPTSPSRLFSGKDFTEFLEIIRTDTVAEHPKVPGHLFFLIHCVSRKILGAIQVRHHINHPKLIETGGHIGYGVRPSERQKGYATTMLSLGLKESKNLGIKRALLTCNEDNLGSRKVIEANGGIFERLGEKEDGTKVRRYWISI